MNICKSRSWQVIQIVGSSIGLKLWIYLLAEMKATKKFLKKSAVYKEKKKFQSTDTRSTQLNETEQRKDCIHNTPVTWER